MSDNRKPMPIKFFRNKNNTIVPNCYKWAEKYFNEKCSSNLSNITLDMEELCSINNNTYLSCNFNIEFKRDINLPFDMILIDEEYYEKYGIQKK